MTTSQVRLEPMTEAGFQVFVDSAVAGYAAEKVAAGTWPSEKSLDLAREEFVQLLPGGLATPDNYLFSARDAQDGARVGRIWTGTRGEPGSSQAFVYDIEVEAELRGKGYGRSIMLAAADWAREKGFRTFGLHVFGHNEVARALYTSLGFVTTDLNMSLAL